MSLAPMLAVACVIKPADSGKGADCSHYVGVGTRRSIAHHTRVTPRALCIISDFRRSGGTSNLLVSLCASSPGAFPTCVCVVDSIVRCT